MKSDIKLIELKGIETPSFLEPIGEEYIKAMHEIYLKVEEKRIIRGNSVNKIKELSTKLTTLKHQILMAEDEFEEIEIRKRIDEVKEQLDHTEDYTGLDVNEYARKLISNPEVEKLREKAQEEYLTKAQIVKTYKEELDKQYKQSIKETNRFVADYQSDSFFRQANVKYNSYKK